MLYCHKAVPTTSVYIIYYILQYVYSFSEDGLGVNLLLNFYFNLFLFYRYPSPERWTRSYLPSFLPHPILGLGGRNSHGQTPDHIDGRGIFYPFSLQYGRKELCPCLFPSPRSTAGCPFPSCSGRKQCHTLVVLPTGASKGLGGSIQS